MAKRKQYDWEAIEREYRAGVLSIREIAKQHGCSDAAIRKNANRFGWDRDLSKKIAEKVRTQVVRTQVRTADPQTEREIIERAAATQVEIVRSHQTRIQTATSTVEKLLATLDTAADEEGATENIQRNSSAAVNLTTCLQRLITLERQAFNIDDETQTRRTSLSDILAEIDGTSKGLPNG